MQSLTITNRGTNDLAVKTNNRNRSTAPAKSNTKEKSEGHGLLNSKGRISGCFHVRDDGTHIEFELATDPPEAAFWSTYRLKPSHIKVVGKYDRSEKAALAREICNSIVEHEKPPPKPKPKKVRRRP
jgi:hypothetical protein